MYWFYELLVDALKKMKFLINKIVISKKKIDDHS